MSIRRPILPPVSALRTLESLDRLRTAAAIVNPKFSSWSLIPVSLGRCFHAISIG